MITSSASSNVVTSSSSQKTPSQTAISEMALNSKAIFDFSTDFPRQGIPENLQNERNDLNVNVQNACKQEHEALAASHQQQIRESFP